MSTDNHATRYDRRKFIMDLSYTSLSLLASTMLLGGCEDILDSIANRPVRRMLRNTPEGNNARDIYRQAVQAMKALPSSDKRNWTNQAHIHTNYCSHQNWFFFPWHRIYLFELEKICRILTGEKDFGLPYWNWCADGHVPDGFLNSSGGNALYDSTRAVNSSSVAASWAVGLTLVDGYCSEPDFGLFAGGTTTNSQQRVSFGNIEGTPHNYIHGAFILGNMADPATAALDPIFYNHHCMVDLCWYERNITRNFPNTNDAGWANTNFPNHFCDENGASIPDITPLAAILMPVLSYRYETGIDVSSSPHMTFKNKADLEKAEEIIKRGAQTNMVIKERYSLKKAVQINIERPASEVIEVNTENFSRVLDSGSRERAILRISKLSDPPAESVFLRVFIDKPDATKDTSTDDPHYAGSLYFFVHRNPTATMNHMQSQPDYLVDITPTLRRLRAEVNNPQNVKVTIVGVPLGEVSQNVTIFAEDIEIIISPITVTLMKFQ